MVLKNTSHGWNSIHTKGYGRITIKLSYTGLSFMKLQFNR